MRWTMVMLSIASVSTAWAVDPPAPAPAPAAMPSMAAAPTAPVANAPVDYKKFRDPFKEPSVVETAITKSELERYPITDFKVVAIITGPIRMRAMLTAPDGKTHYVSEQMKIGTRDGVIVKITTKSIVVREKVVNPLGEVEQFDSEIGMDQPTSGSTQ